MRDPNTDNVIDFLRQLFRSEGIPAFLVSDNGVQFVSNNMRSFLTNFGVKHLTTALYSPQGNGLVERVNRILKDSIQLAVSSGLQIQDAVSERICSYNNTPHSTTGETPFALLRGRQSSNELSPEWVIANSGIHDCTPDHEQVRLHVEESQDKSKVRYEDDKRVKAENFVVGQRIRVRRPFKKEGSKFYPVNEIIKVSKRAVKVTGGKWWSKRNVAKVKKQSS